MNETSQWSSLISPDSARSRRLTGDREALDAVEEASDVVVEVARSHGITLVKSLATDS